MTCDSAARLIDAYMDSELDSAVALEVESHLAECASCRVVLESRQELSRAIKHAAAYVPAPARLRLQVRRRTSSRLRLRFGFATTALAFAFGVAIVLGVWRPWTVTPPLQDRILADVLLHHKESIACGHFTDIGTGDPKAIQAWNYKKLNFSPRVPAGADQGFSLVGARLDVIAGRTTPVLVYTKGANHTDVFITPSGESDNFGVDREQLHVISWNDCSLGYWIVSDAPLDDLVNLRQDFWGPRRDR